LTIDLNIPSRGLLTNHVLCSLKTYWPENSEKLLDLPIPNYQVNLKLSLPLKLEEIAMPAWATDLGINGQLLVPKESVKSFPNQCNWENVDWWLAIFLLLEGWHERLWEKTKGVIHSYSFRLKGWDKRAWEHAWVNRIAIFLRKWVTRENEWDDAFWGAMPSAKLTVTHDVDAVKKTIPIRFKQGAFNLFNIIKLSFHGKIVEATNSCSNALRMIFGQGDWNEFDELLKMEANAKVSAVFHFYADDRRKNLKRWLFDPGYDISSDELKALIFRIRDDGHEVGLHPAFDAWRDSELMTNQRKILEENIGSTIISCRQHWLRFSWEETWVAQSKSGIKKDSTLMFNDRPGFRNSACLSWSPWNPKNSKPHELTSINSVLMDSHLYDYSFFNEKERNAEITRWTRDCRAVGGQCCFLWHPHTLNEEYGWRGGLECLLHEVARS
jgi:hypothetical protein